MPPSRRTDVETFLSRQTGLIGACLFEAGDFVRSPAPTHLGNAVPPSRRRNLELNDNTLGTIASRDRRFFDKF